MKDETRRTMISFARHFFAIVALLIGNATALTTTRTTSSWSSGIFSISASSAVPSGALASSSTRLFNVPPPSSEDVVAYKAYASKQSPPASFFELQQDCLASTVKALDDGLLLMEIEFPPLPASVLELDDVSAYDVAQANLRLAVDLAKGLVKSNAKAENVAILLPDESEARIAIEKATGRENFKEPAVQIEPGVTVSSLRRSEEGDDRLIKVRTTIGEDCLDCQKWEVWSPTTV
jgi:hypothetical protein